MAQRNQARQPHDITRGGFGIAMTVLYMCKSLRYCHIHTMLFFELSGSLVKQSMRINASALRYTDALCKVHLLQILFQNITLLELSELLLMLRSYKKMSHTHQYINHISCSTYSRLG